jgi:hypothetical protein
MIAAISPTMMVAALATTTGIKRRWGRSSGGLL